jgi:hypothetical protein
MLEAVICGVTENWVKTIGDVVLFFLAILLPF